METQFAEFCEGIVAGVRPFIRRQEGWTNSPDQIAKTVILTMMYNNDTDFGDIDYDAIIHKSITNKRTMKLSA